MFYYPPLHRYILTPGSAHTVMNLNITKNWEKQNVYPLFLPPYVHIENKQKKHILLNCSKMCKLLLHTHTHLFKQKHTTKYQNKGLITPNSRIILLVFLSLRTKLMHLYYTITAFFPLLLCRTFCWQWLAIHQQKKNPTKFDMFHDKWGVRSRNNKL